MLKVLLKPNESRDHVEISPDSMLILEQICNKVVGNGGIALICDYGHNGTGTDTFRLILFLLLTLIQKSILFQSL